MRRSDARVRSSPRKRLATMFDPLAPDTSGQTPYAVDLDGPKARQIHARLLGHFTREVDLQREARAEMAFDEDIYDGDQWKDEEKVELENRGQIPLVFNLTQSTVNWVVNTQREARVDPRILPRQKEGLKEAEHKGAILKYLSDVNHTHFAESDAFQEVVIAGLSFLEAGYRNDDDGEPLYERYESWRNVWWDSLAQHRAFEDGRYIFRVKWMDVDIASQMFPQRAGLIRSSAADMWMYGTGDTLGDDPSDSREDRIALSGIATGSIEALLDGSRPRVRVLEAWYRMPTDGLFLAGGDFAGERFDPYSTGHAREVRAGRAEVIKKRKMTMRVALMTQVGMIYHGVSPYRHNRYPLTPIWGNRRRRDGMPYGIVRQVRDAQRDLNKRAAKALYALSVKRVLYENGSLEDPETIRDEVSRVDAMIPYKQGHQAPTIETDHEQVVGQMDLMANDASMIERAGGVTDENLGRTTNATSGKAIIARQEQGSLTTAHYFDNLRFAKLIHGEKMIVNVEQFMTDARQFRITNKRGNPEYIAINGQGADGMDESADEMVQIGIWKADFVISEDDWKATQRQAQVVQLLELLQQLAPAAPQIVITVLDLLIEAMDIPKRDEIVKRIRQQTGMTDPDEDPQNPSPETQAIQAAQAEQQDFQKRMAMAELQRMEADAIEKIARARKTGADADRVHADQASVVLAQLVQAINAATELTANPTVAPVADRLMVTAQAEAEASAASATQGHTTPNTNPQPVI